MRRIDAFMAGLIGGSVAATIVWVLILIAIGEVR